MATQRLMVMDACTVISLHELDLWNAISAKFKITITETVKVESDYYLDKDHNPVPIELGPEIEVVTVQSKAVADFRARFTSAYLAKLDPGETESLVFLLASEGYKICSSDAIVYKVLGCLGEGDRCVSLEGLLKQVGLTRNKYDRWCREAFRVEHLAQGWNDKLFGIAMKPES